MLRLRCLWRENQISLTIWGLSLMAGLLCLLTLITVRIALARHGEYRAPMQIERVLTIRPGSELQLVEQGRVLQRVEILPGRYRIRVTIKQED